MKVALALLVALALPFSFAPASAQSSVDAPATDARVAELERKVDVLVQELEALRMPAAAETTRAATRGGIGLGPSASKVYGARGVSLGGYGEMLYENFDHETEGDARSGLRDRIDFLRHVIYAGYRFDDDLLLDSEIELEHAGVLDEGDVAVDPSSGEGEAELSGEVKLEFAFLDWAFAGPIGLRAGMLLVPVGMLNEIHEPTTYPGARRPETERFIVPATWSANGVGLSGRHEALSWRAYLLEGLDGRGFDALSGIRGGRQEATQALATHPALAARADWSGSPGLLVGGSVYTGEAWQSAEPAGIELEPRVTLFDAHARLERGPLDLRAMWAQSALSDASDLSDALGLAGDARLGKRAWGVVASAQLDVLSMMRPGSRGRVAPYVRFERFDTQDDVPGGSENPAAERTVVTYGAALQPHPNVVLKLDREQRSNRADTETSRWNAAVGYVF